MYDGAIFKWCNQKAIYEKNRIRTPTLKAKIAKIHTKYIGTRSGVDLGDNPNHGIFGELHSKDGQLIDPQSMELNDITKYTSGIAKEGKDIFQCVISLNIDDALALGYNDKEKWKELIDSKISDILSNMDPPIDRTNVEYIAAFHVKEPNMHCHLDFWDKNQKDFTKKPFMKYPKIKNELSKEIFSAELKSLYEVKDNIKKELKDISDKNLEKYKDDLKEKFKIRGDIEIKLLDNVSEEENFINEITKNMKYNDKIYIYDENDPTKFTEITKNTDTFLYKNNGGNGLFYNKNTITDTACFMQNINKIKVCKNENEFKDILKNYEESQDKILNYIEQTRPEILPDKFFSNKFVENFIPDIADEIYNLKNTLEKQFKEEGKKMTFRYGYLSSEMKLQIDKVSNLVLNTSKDCRDRFNEYVKNYLKIEELKGKYNLEQPEIYNEIKTKAEKEMYNIMGNQILQFMKENIKELKEEKEIRKIEFQNQKTTNKNTNLNKINLQNRQNFQAKSLIKGLARNDELC